MGHCQAAGPDAPGRWFPFLRSNMSALLAPGTVTSFCKAKKVAVFFKLLDFIKENVQKSLVMAAEPRELKHRDFRLFVVLSYPKTCLPFANSGNLSCLERCFQFPGLLCHVSSECCSQ